MTTQSLHNYKLIMVTREIEPAHTYRKDTHSSHYYYKYYPTTHASELKMDSTFSHQADIIQLSLLLGSYIIYISKHY